MEKENENLDLQKKIENELNEKSKLTEQLDSIQSESVKVQEECGRLKSFAEELQKELNEIMIRKEQEKVDESPEEKEDISLIKSLKVLFFVYLSRFFFIF